MRLVKIVPAAADVKMNEINEKCSVFWHLLIRFALHVSVYANVQTSHSIENHFSSFNKKYAQNAKKLKVWH